MKKLITMFPAAVLAASLLASCATTTTGHDHSKCGDCCKDNCAKCCKDAAGCAKCCGKR